MVSTYQIKPSPLLQSYISCYSLRSFNTGDMLMPKPLHAIQELYMSFFLKEQFCILTDEDGNIKGAYPACLCSLFTQSQGCTWWKGDYDILCVQFVANGICLIFGIPQSEIVNKIIPVADILGDCDYEMLTEQLKSAGNIHIMGKILDQYFLDRLLKRKSKEHMRIIACMANYITRNKGMVSIDSLASESNMSLRTFERQFTAQVGMPVKLYARISRFFSAMENKWLNPQKSWTDITYEHGYTDQAHFIKECKEFSSRTPGDLFKATPPPHEALIIL